MYGAQRGSLFKNVIGYSTPEQGRWRPSPQIGELAIGSIAVGRMDERLEAFLADVLALETEPANIVHEPVRGVLTDTSNSPGTGNE
jgi:hypothetical protein